MKTNFLIYGAYGYTGKLIVERAVNEGLRPVLGGRDAGKTRALAEQYGLPFVVFDTADERALRAALEPVAAVLHCAGPFSKTTPAMAGACLATHTHYLDITGEIEVFEHLAALDAPARRAGVTLLPGVGFDVVPSDCLALHLKEQLPDAVELQLAFRSLGAFSRGTALTAAESMDKGGMIRRNGQLTPVPAAYDVRAIDFDGTGAVPAVTIPWGDVATAFYSTGIPNIRVYMAQGRGMIRFLKLSRKLGWLLRLPVVKRFVIGLINRRVQGPTEQQRQTGRSYLWGQVSNAAGGRVTARLVTPEAYHLTAVTALLATQRILAGNVPTGFQTPAKAFGAAFIREVAGVALTPVSAR